MTPETQHPVLRFMPPMNPVNTAAAEAAGIASIRVIVFPYAILMVIVSDIWIAIIAGVDAGKETVVSMVRPNPKKYGGVV